MWAFKWAPFSVNLLCDDDRETRVMRNIKSEKNLYFRMKAVSFENVSVTKQTYTL